MRRKEDLRGLTVTWKQPCGNKLYAFSSVRQEVVGTQVDVHNKLIMRQILCSLLSATWQLHSFQENMIL